MIERWYESIKYEHLYLHEIDDGPALAEHVAGYQRIYNDVRPHETIGWGATARPLHRARRSGRGPHGMTTASTVMMVRGAQARTLLPTSGGGKPRRPAGRLGEPSAQRLTSLPAPLQPHTDTDPICLISLTRDTGEAVPRVGNESEFTQCGVTVHGGGR